MENKNKGSQKWLIFSVPTPIIRREFFILRSTEAALNEVQFYHINLFYIHKHPTEQKKNILQITIFLWFHQKNTEKRNKKIIFIRSWSHLRQFFFCLKLTWITTKNQNSNENNPKCVHHNRAPSTNRNDKLINIKFLFFFVFFFLIPLCVGRNSSNNNDHQNIISLYVLQRSRAIFFFFAGDKKHSRVALFCAHNF